MIRFERLWIKPKRYWRLMLSGQHQAADAVLSRSRTRYSNRYDAHASELDRKPIYTGEIGRFEGFTFTERATP